MAFATVSLIGEKYEPGFWLVIFVFCAWVIAKVCQGKYFLHGFFVSIINSVWITAVHLMFRRSYVLNHPEFAPTNLPSQFVRHPRLVMALVMPVFGVLFGIILGLFALVASKLIKPNED